MSEKHPLVGRGFHTQHDNFKTEWQGEVIADLGQGYFMVQLFEWFVGGASTQHVLHLSDFSARHENGVPRFRFFESMKVANSYMENTAHHRDALLNDQSN